MVTVASAAKLLLQEQALAPRLSLPENFRVRYFGSSRNLDGIGKYLPPLPMHSRCARVAVPGCRSPTHVSETRLEDSASQPVQRPDECRTSEISVDSGEVLCKVDRLEVDDSNQIFPRPQGRKCKASGLWSRLAKRKELDPTRMWQESWAAKYTWGKGEFLNGILVAVICVICTSVDGRKKSIVPKNDNLAKHHGKRTCLVDGYPEVHLREGDTYVAHNCQHLKNCKEWASRRPGLVADQV